MTAAAGKFAVGTDGSIYGSNGNFEVDSVGNVTAAGGVTAAAGKFAVGTDGSIYGSNGNFEVDSVGNVTTAGNADITGSLTAADGQFKYGAKTADSLQQGANL